MSYKLNRDSYIFINTAFYAHKKGVERMRRRRRRGKRGQSASQQPSQVHAGIAAAKEDEGV